ncbi:MAG TPA: 30S ribosome-binding factor RbfA [Bacteroidales bacterium]|nr:30S ribosome-binding factor RbfA [Bacteroidales bacterium]
MASIRQNKIARLLQKEIAEIFQMERQNLFKGKMITVTVVRVVADMSMARIYLSVFPYKKEEDYLEYINQHAKFMRNQLGKKVRHQLRIVPELYFFLDDSIDYAGRIDELLKQ